MNIFSDDMRRNPFEAYDDLRRSSPVLRLTAPLEAWLVFDYDGVRRVLGDHQVFSSHVPAPRNWFISFDAPQHTLQRALVSCAFTPRFVAGLEPRIREFSRQLLDLAAPRGEMDVAADYAVPLPLMVLAAMIGIPPADWPLYQRWSETILRLNGSRSGGPEAEASMLDFAGVTAEMSAWLADLIQLRREEAADDLLTRLLAAEVDGARLNHAEILGFIQLLTVAGQETAAGLIDNAVLCLAENPDRMARLRARPELLASAIEEVLRYRSPLQWVMRTACREVVLHGVRIPEGALVLPMLGAANRDPDAFAAPHAFDLARDPNPHLAFGQGIHFCLGASLARMAARVAVADLLARFPRLELALDGPWEPLPALNAHGPRCLPVRFQIAHRSGSSAA
jgi:cytochrome P450